MRLTLGALPLLVGGCASTATRYPPTSMHAAELTPIDEGAISVSAGASALGVINDFLGGSPDMSLGVGLPGGFDLRFTGASMSMVDTWRGTGTVGWSHQPIPRFSWGVFGGAALSRHRTFYEVDTYPQTTSGITVDLGEEAYDFTYWNPTPFLGVRTTWRVARWFEVTSGARYAYSMIADVRGDIHGDVTTAWSYADFTGGPVFLLGPIRVGVDIGGLFAFDPNDGSMSSLPRVGIAARGDIPVWGAARQKAEFPTGGLTP